MSVARNARERVRQELTSEIVAAARVRLETDGAPALSLRAVARDLGMVPSALYRYFPSRDALLTRLILDSYEALGSACEAAAGQSGSASARILATSRGIRSWGVTHPHEWALLFGSPVPGYAAPEETIAQALRIPAALSAPLAAAHAAGRLTGRPIGPVPSAEVEAALAPVREALLAGMPSAVVSWATLIYVAVLGATSLELFGHFRNGILDPAAVLDHQIACLLAAAGLED